MTSVRMENVSKYFDAGNTVANYQLNLEVEDGEFLVFLGLRVWENHGTQADRGPRAALGGSDLLRRRTRRWALLE